MPNSAFPSTLRLSNLVGFLKAIRSFHKYKPTFVTLRGVPEQTGLFGLTELGILCNGGGVTILQEQQSGDAGTLTAGIDNVRPFNTIVLDQTREVVDQGGGRFLFPAGTYVVSADVPALKVAYRSLGYE